MRLQLLLFLGDKGLEALLLEFLLEVLDLALVLEFVVEGFHLHEIGKDFILVLALLLHKSSVLVLVLLVF